MERNAKVAQQYASRRRYLTGVPLRRAFLTLDSEHDQTALGRVLTSTSTGVGGGRGGRTRLALLLTMMWVNSGGDHSSTRPARWWGQMIGIPDPVQAARVATSNIKTLADRHLIRIDSGDAGMPPALTLLDEFGTGAPYRRPDGSDGLSYFRIPEALWTTGAIGALTGPGLAMYLILLHYHRAESPGTWLSPRYFHARHGLSEGTRLNGISDLYTNGVITVRQQTIDNNGRTEGKTTPRRVLTLNRSYAPPPASRKPSPTVPFADPPQAPSTFTQVVDAL